MFQLSLSRAGSAGALSRSLGHGFQELCEGQVGRTQGPGASVEVLGFWAAVLVAKHTRTCVCVYTYVFIYLFIHVHFSTCSFINIHM